ncbi:hypothetical protein ACEWAO_23945, partial [Vibrio parahaemolyticus]
WGSGIGEGAASQGAHQCRRTRATPAILPGGIPIKTPIPLESQGAKEADNQPRLVEAYIMHAQEVSSCI